MLCKARNIFLLSVIQSRVGERKGGPFHAKRAAVVFRRPWLLTQLPKGEEGGDEMARGWVVWCIVPSCGSSRSKSVVCLMWSSTSAHRCAAPFIICCYCFTFSHQTRCICHRYHYRVYVCIVCGMALPRLYTPCNDLHSCFGWDLPRIMLLW